MPGTDLGRQGGQPVDRQVDLVTLVLAEAGVLAQQVQHPQRHPQTVSNGVAHVADGLSQLPDDAHLVVEDLLVLLDLIGAHARHRTRYTQKRAGSRPPARRDRAVVGSGRERRAGPEWAGYRRLADEEMLMTDPHLGAMLGKGMGCARHG